MGSASKSILRSFARAIAIALAAGSTPAPSVSPRRASSASSSVCFKALSSFASTAGGRARSRLSAPPAVQASSEEAGQMGRRSPSAWVPSTAILVSDRSSIRTSDHARRGMKSQTRCLGIKRHGYLCPAARLHRATTHDSIRRASSSPAIVATFCFRGGIPTLQGCPSPGRGKSPSPSTFAGPPAFRRAASSLSALREARSTSSPSEPASGMTPRAH